jgi:hypothetical protein
MNKTSVFNSLLLSVALGVLFWVGNKTAATGEAVVALQTGVAAMVVAQAKDERANAEAHTAIQGKLDGMVPRRDFDTRLLQIEADLRGVQLRLREFDLELIKLREKGRQ